MELTAETFFGKTGERGSSAVEFALVFPLFLILFFGIVEFSWYMLQKSLLSYAVNQGAEASSTVSPTATEEEIEAFVVNKVLDLYYGSLDLTAFDVQVFILPEEDASTPSGDASVVLPRRVRVYVYNLPYSPLAGFLHAGLIPATLTANAIGVLP